MIAPVLNWPLAVSNLSVIKSAARRYATGPLAEENDLVQVAALRVARSIPPADSQNEAAYLRVVANRACLDELRRFLGYSFDRPAPVPVDSLVPDSLCDPSEEDPREALERADELADLASSLAKAIALLPPREAVLITRIYFRGETQTQIARAEGVDKAVPCRIHRRALQHLRNLLAA